MWRACAGLNCFEGACASCHHGIGKGQQTQYAIPCGHAGESTDVDGINCPPGPFSWAEKLRDRGQRTSFMPAFGGSYFESECAALANYVIAHFGGKEVRVTPDQVAKRLKLPSTPLRKSVQ